LPKGFEFESDLKLDAAQREKMDAMRATRTGEVPETYPLGV